MTAIRQRAAAALDRLIRRGRTRAIAMWVGGVVSVYAILGFLVAPPIVRSQLERNLAELLGRQVAIQRVHINPFALSASILGFSLKDRDGSADAFAFDEFHVNVTSSSLFWFAPVIESVRLARPSVRIVRNKDRSYDFQDIIDRFASRPPAPPGPAPRFALYNIQVTDGSIYFDDRPEGAVHAVSDLQIGIPFISSIPSLVDIVVQPRLKAKVNGTPLDLGGETKPFENTRETTLRIDIDELQISRYFEYVPVPLRLAVRSGTLSTRLELSLSTQAGRLHRLTVSGTAGVKNLAVQRSDGAPLIALGALDVDLGELDLVKRRAAVKRVRVDSPKADLIRRKDGQFNWGALALEGSRSEPAESTDAPFLFEVADLVLEGGTVRFVDEGPHTAFHGALDNVALSVTALSNAPETKATVRFSCDTLRKSKLAVEGTLALTPLKAEGKFDLAGLQLGAFAPYIEQVLQVVVSAGALSARGQFSAEVPESGPARVAVRADVGVAGFTSLDKASSQDLLRWKTLVVRGIDFELEPLKIAVDQVTLADFFSRLIVNPDGTLNMQTLATKQEPQAAAPPPAAEKGPPPNLRIGKVTLANGNVNFSDFFVKPNYSIALSGVTGSVTEMTPDKPGEVELRGRIHQTAPLEILGKVNTLSKDLFVDMKASVKDIDLPPATPYSVKYTGYSIQKGKLSVRVEYHIENRKLAAQNNVYLDQFTFGERVDSPTATTLPVLFAVALMKDKNGVIDVDLPISGSLDDPQFSVGGVVVKALVNLVTKAVTSPFALLGALAGGGGEELAFVEYAPGDSALGEDNEKKLETLAKALNERPGLKLEISGRVVPDADREALKRAAVDREIKVAKLKDKGETKGQSVDDVAIAPEERDKYLTAAYKDAKFDRPRNALGLLKDLPAPEMEQLMLANAKVADDDLRRLAFDRAQAPKDWLVENGKIAADRVFIVAPRMSAEGVKDQGKPTRADFSLK